MVARSPALVCARFASALLFATAAALAPAACGPGLLDLDEANDGTAGSTASPGAEGPAPGPDLPPSELGCEAQGGRFVQVAGPWRIQQQLPYHTAAFGVLPGESELVAIWEGPFSPVAPNALGARVGYDGQVLAELLPAWERTVVRPPSIHRAPAGYVVTYCGLYGGSDAATSQLFDASGAPRSTERRREPMVGCSGSRPDGVWTNERYLFAWNGGAPAQVLLDVGDPSDAVSEGFIELSPSGNVSCPPRIAVGTDVVMVVAGVDYDQLHAFSLTHDGLLLDARPLDLPSEFTTGGTAIGLAAVGAAADGSFSVFLASRNEPGLYHTRVDAEGTAPPLTRMDGAAERYAELTLLHRPGGFLLVTEAIDPKSESTVRALVTDDHGQLLSNEALTTSDQPAFQGRPAALMHGGDAWVAYMAGLPDATYDIRLAQLSCVR